MSRSRTQHETPSASQGRTECAPGSGNIASATADLSDLRVRLGGLSKLRNPSDLTAVLPALSSSVDQLMTEHQGMADELLCLYEQLGIVFEITRKLAGVQSEADVLDLFLLSLRRSFAGRDVFAARRHAQGWVLEGSSRPVGEWLRGLLDRAESAANDRTVIVEAAEGGVSQTDLESCGEDFPSRGAGGDGIAEAMIAPVISGEVVVCSLVLLRKRQSPAFQACEMMLIESLTTFCGDLIRSHRLVGELRQMSIAMVRALVNAVDQKDEYTCGHSLRVAYYATTLGQRLGLGEIELQMLQWASLLHDVGKIGIRDNVLKKEGKLTPEEFGHIKEHPIRSHKVVQEVPQLVLALDGILHHHERFDGSGYPDGLKGEQIPYQARIIQIADVFDALTSNRSYRKAFDWRRALGILQEEAGKTVDPHLQQTFDALIRETLQDDPTAWSRMVEHANRYMQGLDALGDEKSDEGTKEGGSERERPGGAVARESADVEGE